MQEQKDEVPTETMGMDEFKMHKTSDRLSLSEKIELIEQKFSKLQSLKDDTMDELSSLLNESNRTEPRLIHLFILLYSLRTITNFESFKHVKFK